jgi:hypothetical protein
MKDTVLDIPAVFRVGNNSDIGTAGTFGVSFDGIAPITGFTFYNKSTSYSIESAQDYTKKWIHFAIVSDGTTVKFYKNGVNIGEETLTDPVDYFAGRPVYIGQQDTPLDVTAFKGYITNFRWVIGTQVYTSNFNVPTEPLTAISGTKLLLNASSPETFTDDSSPDNLTVTNVGAIYSVQTPF